MGMQGEVGYIEAYKRFFKGYANFTGRSTVAEFWKAYFFQLAITLGLVIWYFIDLSVFTREFISGTYSSPTDMYSMMTGLYSRPLYIILIIFSYGTLLPTLAIMARRLRDSGQSPWFTIAFILIPIGGFIMMFIMLRRPSLPPGVLYGRTPGPYGPQPYGQQQAPYGQQQPPYGQQQPPYGTQQPPYGQQQPPYGAQQPPYGQQQPPYGTQQPPYGQQQPPYGAQQAPYGPQQPPYGTQQPPYGQPPYEQQQPYGQAYGAPQAEQDHGGRQAAVWCLVLYIGTIAATIVLTFVLIIDIIKYSEAYTKSYWEDGYNDYDDYYTSDDYLDDFLSEDEKEFLDEIEGFMDDYAEDNPVDSPTDEELMEGWGDPLSPEEEATIDQVRLGTVEGCGELTIEEVMESRADDLDWFMEVSMLGDNVVGMDAYTEDGGYMSVFFEIYNDSSIHCFLIYQQDVSVSVEDAEALYEQWYEEALEGSANAAA
jgi:uncharacterized membrane protein YhaH (DUF805 family)